MVLVHGLLVILDSRRFSSVEFRRFVGIYAMGELKLIGLVEIHRQVVRRQLARGTPANKEIIIYLFVPDKNFLSGGGIVLAPPPHRRREAVVRWWRRQPRGHGLPDQLLPDLTMGLHGGEYPIRREPEDRQWQRRWERRLRPIWLSVWIVVVLHALSSCCCCRRRTLLACLKLGENWPASANWTGGSEDQKEGGVGPPFSASPPSSLVDVRRQPIQKLESNLKHADACMQAHRSPSDGGKLDEGRLVRR